MKQLTLYEFSCQICFNDLMVTSMDLMVNETITYFKCSRCSEQYFSSEIPNTSTKSPDFKCPFCQTTPLYLSLVNDWNDYWKCIQCDSSFEARYSEDWDGINVINIYSKFNDKLYCIRQFLAENITKIESVGSQGGLHGDYLTKTIIELDFLL